MAFPDDLLTLKGELYIDGAWVDVSEYIRGINGQNAFRINRGYANEQKSLQAATCSFRLNNPEGRFSNRNPLSPYYGKLPRNTPFRVRVDEADSYLRVGPFVSGSKAVADDAAALDITGDIDIAVDIEPSSWTDSYSRTIAGKYKTSSDQRSWFFALRETGGLQFLWTTDGTLATRKIVNSTAVLPASTDRLSVRAVLDVNNGAAGNTVTFYYSTAGPTGPWTVLGSPVVTAGTTSIFNSNAGLDIGGATPYNMFTGGSNFNGKLHRVIVKNSSGTVVADADFANVEPGTNSVLDSYGNTFVLGNGARVSNDAVRFVGEISKIPYQADSTNTDVYSSVDASGIIRRLSQGATPLHSPLYRMLSQYSPTAYFPMEDGSGATSLANAASNAPAGTLNLVSFTSDPDLAGSAGVMNIDDANSAVHGEARSTANTSSASFSFFFKMPALPASNTLLIRLFCSSGPVRRWDITATPTGTFIITGYSGTNAVVTTDTANPPFTHTNTWVSMNLALSTVSGNLNWVVNYNQVGSSDFRTTGINSVAGSVGRFTDFYIWSSSNLVGTKFAHLMMTQASFSVVSYAYANASVGYAGETAMDRMARLCLEENVPFFYYDNGGDSEQMGPQPTDTFINLLEDCRQVDDGLLFEPRDVLGIEYISRAGLLNLPVTFELDMSLGHLSPDFLPVDDDQRLRNDVTVSRPNGSSATAVKEDGPNSILPSPDGVGRYTESLTLNAFDDSRLSYLAAWKVFLGTWDEARYEQVFVQLSRQPYANSSALTGAVISADVGSYGTVAGLPIFQSADDVELLVLGYEEILGQRQWDIRWNAVPYGPYKANILDVSGPDRLDAEDSSLASGVNSTATSLSITAVEDSPWITTAANPTEFPFDIRVGGEIMTVTAISGTSFPQTFTVTRSVNGVVKSHTAGTLVRLADPFYMTL